MRLSYEFFPPRSEQGQQSLLKVANKLDQFAPDFYSVTYGAGGSTRDGTRDTVNLLQRGGRSAAPHLSIGEAQPDTIRHMLSDFQTDGVQRIVALRGDVPSGAGGRKRTHNAEELVRWIRDHSDRHFHNGSYPYPLPAVLGHESAGVVEAVGSDVTYVKPGDHVITCLSAFCGQER